MIFPPMATARVASARMVEPHEWRSTLDHGGQIRACPDDALDQDGIDRRRMGFLDRRQTACGFDFAQQVTSRGGPVRGLARQATISALHGVIQLSHVVAERRMDGAQHALEADGVAIEQLGKNRECIE